MRRRRIPFPARRRVPAFAHRIPACMNGTCPTACFAGDGGRWSWASSTSRRTASPTAASSPAPDAAVAHAPGTGPSKAPTCSTSAANRPGPAPQPVPLDEELRRVVPVVEALAAASRRAALRRHLQGGGGRAGPGGRAPRSSTTSPRCPAIRDMAEVVRDTRAGVVLMHMQGTPQTMQRDPHYDDVVGGGSRVSRGAVAGAGGGRYSGGAGGASTPASASARRASTTCTLLARLGEFQQLGRPVCLGVSRKGFLGRLLRPAGGATAGRLAGRRLLRPGPRRRPDRPRPRRGRKRVDAVTVIAAIADRNRQC